MPIEFEGETYLTVKEAADYLGISKPTFYANVKPYVTEYRIGALRRVHYRQSDLERFRGVSPVDRSQE